MDRRVIRFYLFIESASSFFCALIFVTYTIFLSSLGLDAFQMNLVNASFMVAIVILELPTGIVADLFGRKTSLLLHYLFFGLSFVVYSIAQDMTACIVAEVIGAIGATFISGAQDAWLVDSLAFHSFKGELAVVMAKGERFRALAAACGVLVGAVLADHWSLRWLWLAAGIGVWSVGLFAAVYMKEEYFKRADKEVLSSLKKSAKTAFVDSTKHLAQNRKIIWLMALGAAWLMPCQPVNMYWSLILRDRLGVIWPLGLVLALVSISVAAGSYYAQRVAQSKIRTKYALAVIVVATGLATLMASTTVRAMSFIAWFLAHEVARAGFRPLRSAYIQKRFKSEIRATLGSIDSLSEHTGAALGLVVFGWLAKTFSYEMSWLFSGLAFSLVGVAVLLSNGQKKAQ